jgi:hypothetical protein
VVLPIGQACNRLIQATHEPGHIRQSLAPATDQLIRQQALTLRQHGTGQPLTHEWRTGKQLEPTLGYFMRIPVLSCLSVDAHDYMVVIVHHGIGTQVDGKGR